MRTRMKMALRTTISTDMEPPFFKKIPLITFTRIKSVPVAQRPAEWGYYSTAEHNLKTLPSVHGFSSSRVLCGSQSTIHALAYMPERGNRQKGFLCQAQMG